MQFLHCQTNIRLSFYIFCDRFLRFIFLVSVRQANLTCKQAKRSELYIHSKQRSSITFYLLVMVILSLIMMMNYQMMMIPVDPRLLWFCPQLRSIPRRPLSSSFSDRPQFSKWDPAMEIGMEMMIVNELSMRSLWSSPSSCRPHGAHKNDNHHILYNIPPTAVASLWSSIKRFMLYLEKSKEEHFRKGEKYFLRREKFC